MSVLLKDMEAKLGACSMQKEPSVEEMKAKLGLDQCRPIEASPSDALDMQEKGDVFKEWYEQEIKRLYKEATKG
ncbi:hypothetical protein MFMK1_001949 [Metallumcola ferriviriculae]|uniref:Uncharacterized protein n=1 Tax=Metallumcola ferriviriculae TaxID=3039180 RepID=A0AAU0UP89_9FIRM|nr:hypothetical protein MFMK1_001949 [Desulfitibacteraceae bacterium MK1]